MRRLTIDFASQTLASRVYALPIWCWPLLFLGLVAVALAVLELSALASMEGRARESLAAVQQRIDARADKPSTASLASVGIDQAATINRAIRQLNTPWSDLFDAIEAASQKNVALIEIKPDPATRRLVGSAEAKSSDGMVRYMNRLKAQPLFADAQISSHQINDQDKTKPLRFEFVATWREAQ